MMFIFFKVSFWFEAPSPAAASWTVLCRSGEYDNIGALQFGLRYAVDAEMREIHGNWPSPASLFEAVLA